MSEGQRAQCLLFVEADRKPGYRRKSSRSLANASIKGYALLPQSFRDEHPKVIEIFSRNDIKVISYAEDDSSLQTTLKHFTLDMFEFQLMFENSESEDVPSNASNPLLILVDDFNREVVSLLLSRDVKIARLLDEGRTGYLSVDSNDDLKVIENFISCGKDVDNKICKDIGYRHYKGGTILHFAVKRGQEKLVKLLLRNGVDVNAKRPDGMTPLHIAAKKGLVEVVKTLLQFGGNANAETQAEVEGDRGFTPLLFAHRNFHPEVVGLLLDSGADVNIQFNNFVPHHYMHYFDTPEENVGILGSEGSLFKVTLLYSATLLKNVEEIKFILRHKPDLNNEYNKRAFHYILFELEDDFKDIFEQMRECGFVIDYSMFENSIKFLFGAIHKNCVEVVRRMMEAGVNVNEAFECHSFFQTLMPLQMAARHAGKEIIELLLKNGADGNTELAKSKEYLILDAIQNNNINAVKCFVAKKINFPDEAYLIFIAAGNRNSELIEFLLVNGYPLTFKDEFNLALARAAYYNYIEIIELLFKYGAQLSSEYVNYTRALCNAISGHPEIFQAILDYSFTNVETIKYSEVFRQFEHYS